MDWVVFPWEPFEEVPNREMYEHLGGSIDAVDTFLEPHLLEEEDYSLAQKANDD